MEEAAPSLSSPDLTELESELRQLAESANEKLFQAGAISAERSFGLGCVVFALPVVALVTLLFILQVFNLILSLIVLTMGALVVAGLVTLVAYSARTRAIHNAYEREIAPEIHQYLSAHHASRSQFDQVASQALSEDAPLRLFLAPIPAGETPLTEEE
jgi:hypothetical protein